MKMLDFVGLEEKCKNNLAELLCNVDNRDFVWLDEILEEAKKIFKSSFDGEPELMPKTPSQKNRRKKKRISTTKNSPFSEKSYLSHSSCRMTRSQAARISNATCKTATVDLARGRIPLVEIHNHERLSAELHLEKTAAQKTKKADLANKLSLDGEDHTETLQPLSIASLLIIPDTPETQIKKDEGRSACKLKIANLAVFKTTETVKPSPQAEELLAQPQDNSQDSETKLPCNLHESSQTCSAKKANRQSVRRSLMGKTSMNKASLAQRCSLSSKRERAIQKSGKRTMSMRSTTREQSSTGRVSLVKLMAEEITVSRPQLDSASHSQEVADQPFSPSHQVSSTAAVAQQHEGKSKENSSEKNAEVQDQPQSIRRKASYKRAVNELCDGQHTEDEFSPPRKKSPSPQCPASKVVRPFKTFLHTVHKNQVLMMTPGSVSQNSAIKSFLKYNTPLRTNPKEKERQRLETLKKKQEAEEQRKQKMEEEKRRRLEEIKRKREEHIRKVLQARERVEQREEEKKKLLEQKFAQNNEKVREERMAEEKVKKAAAAKKAEALEARKRRALQLEERRQQELMQRMKEEEQEKARQTAELEKKLAAERELEKQREQEKLRAQQELERKEKREAARLQRELMAAKKKEQLLKEAEEKERKRQEEEQKQKSTSDAVVGHEQLNATIQIKSSPSCNSYPMTPQGPKQPKFDENNYGMDQNSDDSTDDESNPRKPIPAWATGNQLSKAIIHQYYNPPDIDAFFGIIRSPKLEEIFCKSKPRYQKRTSSAVWNSPPFPYGKSMTGQSWEGLKRC